MAEDTTSLRIKVETVGVDKADKGLDGLAKSARDAERATDSLGKTFKSAGASGASAVSSFRGIYAALAGIGALQLGKQIIETADSFQNLNAKLIIATGSAEAANEAYNKLLNVARNSHAPIEQTAELYTRLAFSTKTIGLSSDALVTATDTVGKAMRLSGADAAAASGAIRQLGQAMASGVLRGDEFNSIMETSPRLAKAIADSMGITTDSLRQYAADGKLSAAEVGKALITQNAVISKEAENFKATVGTSMQDIRNELFDTFGKTATGPLVESMTELTNIFKDPETKDGLRSFASGVADLAGMLVKAAAAAGNAVTAFSDYKKLMGMGEGADKGMAEINQLQKGIDQLKAIPAGEGAFGLFAGGQTGMGMQLHLSPEEVQQQIASMEAWKKALEETYWIERQAGEQNKQNSAEKTVSMDKDIAALDAYSEKKKAELQAAEDLKDAEREAASERKRALKEVENLEKQRVQNIQNIIQGLRDEVATQGKTSQETIAYQLQLYKALPEQIAEAKRLQGQKDIFDLERQLMTEEEKLRESYDRRKSLILANTSSGAGQDALLARNEKDFSTGIMGSWGQEPTTLDGQMAKLQEEFDAKYAQAQGHEQLMFDLKAEYEEKKAQLVNGYYTQQLDNAASLFDGMAGMAKTFAGEESKAYKILFATSKAFSIAKAIMNMGVAISNANTVPFPANIAAIASAAAQGASALSTVRGASFSGAYDQGGVIPSGSFGLVGEKGPELVRGSANVIGRKETASLLENAGNNKPEVKVLVINLLDKTELINSFKNSDEFDEVIVNSLSRNQSASREAMG
jgi:tape measure domain-containing protein